MTSRPYRWAVPPELIDKVDQLKAAGHSGAKIARHLGINVRTIRDVIRRIGAYRDVPADTRTRTNPYANNGGLRRKHVPPALTTEQVREIKRQRGAGAMCKELAFAYGVSRATITNAIHGHTPSYKGVVLTQAAITQTTGETI